MNKKQIVVISAPSCSGKNSVYDEVRKKYPFIKQTVSDTTRKIRSNEKAGIDYNYISEKEFLENIKNGVYVEHNYYDEHYYGTPLSEIERFVKRDEPFILIIDVKGALKVKELFGDKVIMIFILPPSIEELERRMIARGENTSDDIDKRIETAKFEISQSEKYDFCIVNDELSKASQQVIEIIEKEVLMNT